MVVARLAMPFNSIKAKKLTENVNACITNQYLTVSSNQMITDVTKTIRIFTGERREAKPSRNFNMMPEVFSRAFLGNIRSISH